MLNKVILQGRLGSNPELKTTPNGVEVCSVNIAVDRDRKDQNGERQTDWVTIQAWRGTAKFLSQYFTKGRMVLVEGRLQMRNYTDKDGNKRTAAEVVADNIYFGDSQRNDSQNDTYTHTYTSTDNAAAPAPGQFEEISDNGEPLPF